MSGGSRTTRILGLQHVALPYPGTSEALAAARRFYGEWLGLDALPAPDALADTVLWFATGAQELHLYPEPRDASVNEGSTRHPCLQVAALDSFRDRLVGLGVETIDAVPDLPGRPRFFVRDPFGNAVEFVELTADDEIVREL